MASQAPTNPDLDVEEEAAERASIAQQNGTTPTDLQISCKFKINYPQCYFLIISRTVQNTSNTSLEDVRIKKFIVFFSDQHGRGEEEAGQAAASQEI